MPTVIDRRLLVAFRAAFFGLMAIGVGRFFVYGWIDTFYTAPRFFFTYEGFAWVRPWPGFGMHVHYAVMGVAAVLAAFGVRYRASVAVFLVCFVYAELIDKTNYLNHYYYVSLCTALMLFMPLDRRDPATVPIWCLYVLRFQAAIVYVFAGLAKLNADWLFAAEPMRTWLAARSEMTPLFEQAWVAYAASWAGALFDCTIVPLLLWRRTRVLAFAAVVVFHVCTRLLFDIGLFPWLMIASAALFFEPKRLPAIRKPLPCYAVAALAVYCAVQIVLPLRRHLHEGDTLWTEEGFRFAWNVMLVEKSGVASFEVKEPSSGRQWHVDPRELLTPLQTKMMATQPDMIEQLAVRIGEDARRAGVRDPQVFVRSAVRFNGRDRRAVFPPEQDLLARRSADHASP